MSNIFDYLAWRGDLSFGNAPLCPVDALIFSMLPYIRLEGFVPPSPREEPVRLADAARAKRARRRPIIPSSAKRIVRRSLSV